MNKRQKKKEFKKRFGFNPPHGISISKVTHFMKHKETIIATLRRLNVVILKLCKQIKPLIIELAEKINKISTTFAVLTKKGIDSI